MNSDNLKKLIGKWVADVGKHEAIKRLIQGDIKITMAQHLVYGTYKSNLSFDNGNAVLRVMEKDGFTLSDEAV